MEDVVGGGLAGEAVEGAQGSVQVGEEELVRDSAVVRGLRGGQGFQCRLNGLLLAQRVQHATGGDVPLCVQELEDSRP